MDNETQEPMDVEVRVFKSFDDNKKLYAFYWEAVDPKHCYIYSYSIKRWSSVMFEAEDFLTQMEEEEQAEAQNRDWTETNLLEMLVTTGWTRTTVFKSILDQIPNGWETLERNLYIADNVDKGKAVLEDLPHVDNRVQAMSELAKKFVKRRVELQKEQQDAKTVQDG